ncbi:hypothetical protein N8J89_19540 [Crossiella sp. CA-258035]|uniref:hypothetical protein n=1 Tax=Crossiella sp. CA-258035 TaxID=2981138 RepID=UPI0024BC5444|nr:hypothetical protein [Crossiella sp. CA-258035]WHT23182.1 hypothetical protein N8J89_19540 [Crossiella sp. CA-258035]
MHPTSPPGAEAVALDRPRPMLEFLPLGLCGEPNGTTVQEQLRGLWFDLAGTPFPNQVPALARAFGEHHLLYGSDCAWTPAPAVRTQLASLEETAQPPGDSWRALTTRNARRLLPGLGR